jgi:hypothetical protein
VGKHGLVGAAAGVVAGTGAVDGVVVSLSLSLPWGARRWFSKALRLCILFTLSMLWSRLFLSVSVCVW